MMRKDINLLYSLTQATKKKSSSNMLILIGVGVLAIVALMVFLFVDAKLEVKNNQALIDDLDSKLGQSSTLSQLQARYNALKAQYESDIAEVIAEISPEQYALVGASMSSKLIDILMLTDEENETDAGYDADDVADNVFDVDITQLSLSADKVMLSCSASTYAAVWDFVDYLAGNRIADLSALDGLIDLNKEYFSDVELNYSGLPPAPTEPGCDLIGNPQDVVFRTHLTQPAQIFGVVKPHATGPLHDRFENHGCQFPVVSFDHLGHGCEIPFVPLLSETHFGSRSEILQRQPSGEDRMHAGHGITHRHGVPCIAVIAASNRGQSIFFGSSLRMHILQGHLRRNLNGHRPRITIEDLFDPIGSHLDQFPRQLHRRRVGKTAEHHVSHLLQLGFDGKIERRVVVSVNDGPPRGHTVNQPAAILQFDITPLGTSYEIDRQRVTH